uniref:RAD51 interacting motif domain-containing protein n=1 Tax=Anabas testudineus TaxID=64144 RepID=A0A7N6AWR3_ANATE
MDRPSRFVNHFFSRNWCRCCPVIFNANLHRSFTRRKTKVVNYCEAKDFDDDEDFACVKAPPSKKAKEDVKQEHKKSTNKTSSQENNSQSALSQKSRRPLDEKLCERDLEAAITLSLLNNADGIKEQSPTSKGKLLCKINTSPDLESDEDFSEPDESEDEEFTVKKVSKTKKEKVTKNQKPKQPPASKKEKPPSKPKSRASVTTPVRSPPAAKLAPKRPASFSTVSTPKATVSLSPAGSKIPKWNPPGQIGKSPTSSQSPAVKSPGQGLRLGLSRLVRVKPLHPSVTSH